FVPFIVLHSFPTRRSSDLLRRPVLSFVMSIVLVLFGLIGFKFLGVRDYPAIDPPNVNVFTTYSGANPDIIESQDTEPLEKSINGDRKSTRLNSSHRTISYA